MKSSWMRSLTAFFFVSLMTIGTPRPSYADTDKTAPSYDMKAQALVDLQAMQNKFVDLAKALPEQKMVWRPSSDSRSFAEVFLHVAGERYSILAMMGTKPPSGFNAKEFEKSSTDRTHIIGELTRSWEFTQKAIQDMSNADFAKLLPKLGPQANEGDVVYILVSDAHEHLGQAVAYARENGIVPPWTVAAQKRAEEKKSAKK
jgi:uncharacterized damage-inducible protein DinB